MFDRIKELLGASADLASEMRTLKDQIETKKQRRDFLRAAPLCKADMLGILDRRLAEADKEFDSMLQTAFLPLMMKPGHLEQMYSNRSLPLLTAPQPNQLPNVSRMEVSVLALFSDQLRPRLIKRMDVIDWSKSGPPMHEREKEIETLDREIGQLEANLNQVRAKINEARQILS